MQDEKHKVRCCSDTRKTGWNYNTGYGCSVFGESELLPIGGTSRICNWEATYLEAVAICDKNDARLCTREEVLDLWCTTGSGCRFDDELVWTSTAEELVYVACGENGKCGEEGDYKVAALDELHEVRCCSDTRKEGWIYNESEGCFVSGESDLKPLDGDDLQCHSESTYDEASNICERNGARLCTFVEIYVNHCARLSGCGFDSELVWTSTTFGELGKDGPGPD
jgi:hypothetical protein